MTDGTTVMRGRAIKFISGARRESPGQWRAAFGPISTNTDIFPVASIFTVFKSKSGKTEEGGLYAPVCEFQLSEKDHEPRRP